MSKKFDMISIFLIIVLVIILFFVIFAYFTGSSIFLSTINPTVGIPARISGDFEEANKKSGDTILPSINQIEKESGEMFSGKETLMSGESGEVEIEIVPETSGDSNEPVEVKKPQNDSQTISNPLILSSDSNISSKEKKEVLKELDQTLMELLEVVDSVKTVDETRLTPKESEVQP